MEILSAAPSTVTYTVPSTPTRRASSPVTTTSRAETPAEKRVEPDEAELKRQELIKKMEPKYTIVKGTEKLLDGTVIEVYRVTAKADVNLSRLKEDLKLNPGVVANCNDGYGKYDGPNGTYIDNKPMKGVTIKFPIDELGKNKSFIERIAEFFGI